MKDQSNFEDRLEKLTKRLNQLEQQLAGQQDRGTGSDRPETHQYCAMPPVIERIFPPGTAPDRQALIRIIAKKWVNGTVLHYYFFDRSTDGSYVQLSDGSRQWRSWVGDRAQQEVVRQAFRVWQEVDISLTFQEVTDRTEAEIRIGFMTGDGAWSYLGRDVLEQSSQDRTMNFGWDLSRDSREIDTAIHEIGHTLGFPHEHQNPNAGIVWDEEAVYTALAGSPNFWSRDKTYHNIIRKLDPTSVEGSQWDPNSIMHYPFGPGLIRKPAQYAQSGLDPEPGLSEWDRSRVRLFYPPLQPQYPQLKPFQSQSLAISPGQQRDFAIVPEATRLYTIRTFGSSDTVMVLFEDDRGDLRYMSADDDGGSDYNAQLRLRLYRSRRYVLRIRLYYTWAAGETAVMMW